MLSLIHILKLCRFATVDISFRDLTPSGLYLITSNSEDEFDEEIFSTVESTVKGCSSTVKLGFSHVSKHNRDFYLWQITISI